MSDRKVIQIRKAVHDRLTRIKMEREVQEDRTVSFSEIIKEALDLLEKVDAA